NDRSNDNSSGNSSNFTLVLKQQQPAAAAAAASMSIGGGGGGGGRYQSQLSLAVASAAATDVIRKQLRGRLKAALCRLFKEKVPGNDSGSCSVYSIAKDALDYLENYLIERFAVLCESPLPATAMEAEDRLVQLFASCNLHSDSVRDMRELAVRKKRKAAIALFECVHRVLPRTADESVCLFTTLVMEHVVCEIMRLSITYMKKIKIYELKKVDIKIVVDTFFSASLPTAQQQHQQQHQQLIDAEYEWSLPKECRQGVNELLYLEETFSKQLQIVCQLFKQPLVELNSSSPDIDTVFSAISQVAECSGLLFVALDDSRNVTDKPPIGHCFYELAEEGNFDSFAKYAQDILNPRCTERLLSLLSNRAVQEKYESLGRTVEQRCLSRLAATALQSQNHRRRQQHQQLPQHYLFSSLDLVSVSAASGGTASSPSDATSDRPDVGDEPTQPPPPPLSASSGETRNCLLLACRYLLPNLLLVPIGHFLYYDRILAHFEQLRDQQISDSSDPVDATPSSTMIGSLGSSEDASSAKDRDAIKQCRSILVSTRHKIDTVLLELERSLTAVGGGTESAATDGWCRPLSPLASRLFFHNSVRSPDADHPDRHCAKKLDQLRQATKSAAEIDARPKCCVFYRDASLWHLEQRGGRFRERRVCLFNNRLFVLKACSKTLALRGSGEEFKLKRVVHLAQYRFCVLDLAAAADAAAAADGAAAGTDDELHTFAIEYLAPAESGDSAGLAAPTRQRAVFGTKSAAEKDDWMLILVYLQCYHMFEDYLFHGVNSKPEEVCFPTNAHGYEFLQPDSDAVLELEENSEYSSSSDSHVIRRATLNKLVEKMTQGPGGIDNRLMPVFLMTYRSFCTPQHLMEKLIARFSIPDYSYADFQTSPDMPMSQAQSRKREFENAYCRRVRLRVLKVMNTWVSEYFHDFVLCPKLVGRMREFLCGPLVERHYDIKKFQAPSLLKNLERRFKGESPSQETPSPADCPEVLWHTTSDPQDFNLMSLHPLELARQITLYMFSLYQRIQPWELVTGDWMKTNEKQRKAPNVHALIRYTNRLTWWCCSNILSTPNLEERRYVLLRVYEIMRHFRDLNNFLGLAALDSVFVNSSVQYIRLQHTWKLIKNGRENSFLQQMQELVSNSNNLAKYDELLRSLSSACVPNLRYHLSCIFRILEINRARQKELPESLQLLCDAEADSTVLVPFFRYRQVADRIDELFRAKDTAYQLREVPEIQQFVQSIDPMGDRKLDEVDDTSQNQQALDDLFYRMSYDLEPKDADEDALKRRGERRFSPECLRSPSSNSGRGAGVVKAAGATAALGRSLLTLSTAAASGGPPQLPHLHHHHHQQHQPHPQQQSSVSSTTSATAASTAGPSPEGSIAPSPNHSRSVSDPVPSGPTIQQLPPQPPPRNASVSVKPPDRPPRLAASRPPAVPPRQNPGGRVIGSLGQQQPPHG
ncbi:hypothetical protein BOX15_Mlig030586g1, partial [Macrostomum lignano]